MTKRLYALLLLAFAAFPKTEAQQIDSAVYKIDSTTVVSARRDLRLNGDLTSRFLLDMEGLSTMPMMFGNADPLKLTQSLPGVQTSSEWTTGLNVQGCDNSHNLITLNNAPVYGAYHLLGFFSVFNPTHFGNMKFSHVCDASRLGASLDMSTTDTIPKRMGGNATIGLFYAQGTFRLPIGRNSVLLVSGRQSFINLLFAGRIRVEDCPLYYDFNDYNISYIIKPSTSDIVTADLYFGSDKLSGDAPKFNYYAKGGWGNSLASLRWDHKSGDFSMRQQLYASGNNSDLHTIVSGAKMATKSRISDYAYSSSYGLGPYSASLDASFYKVLPQDPTVEDLYSVQDQNQDEQRAVELSAGLSRKTELSGSFSLTPKLKLSMYHLASHKTYFQVDPEISAELNLYKSGKFSLNAGYKHQNLTQTGMTNTGMPIEFHLLAGDYSKPQASLYGDVSYNVNLSEGEVGFSTQLYCKRLYNQLEYNGFIFDLLVQKYRLEDFLYVGDGLNFGWNVMLQKKNGPLTGWISYSLGRALRRFDTERHSGIFPSNHERVQELNLVAAYSKGRWSFGGTLVYASGNPFTGAQSFYFSAGKIITEYGRYNGARLQSYVRLDLSANYILRKTRSSILDLNISVYNATASRNHLKYRLWVKRNKLVYEPVEFIIPILPSIGFSYKF